MSQQMNKRKKQKKKKPQVSRAGARQSIIKSIELKYFDINSIANSIGAGATLFPIDAIPQGVGQSSRVSDFVSTRKVILNYSLYCVNSDIVTTIRIILFRWLPSTSLAFPLVADILESPVSINTLSHYNYQRQAEYDILWERQFRAAGIPTAPTTTSNYGQTGLELPVGRFPDQEFSLGATTGTGQLFFLAISDSALTPFPIWNFSVRTYYEDVVRQRPRKLVK